MQGTSSGPHPPDTTLTGVSSLPGALQEGPTAGRKTKAKQAKQQAVEDEVAAFNALAADDGADGKKKKKKKAKVVVF